MADGSVPAVNEPEVLRSLESGAIHTYFQPVVSIPTRSIVGFESFSRGGNGKACLLDASALFHRDLSPGTKVAVDRACRGCALDQFKPIFTRHRKMLLFLNVNADILPHVEAGSDHLAEQARKAGVAPENVVIECNMAHSDKPLLALFAELYRAKGFRIGIDNAGVGQFHARCITDIRPDFFKLNRTFFAEDQRTGFSGWALENVRRIADRVGTILVAQNVETEADSLRLLNAGVTLQQGYYYTKDDSAVGNDPARMFLGKIAYTYDKYKKTRRQQVRRRKERFDAAFKTVASACARLASCPEHRFEAVGATVLRSCDHAISLFVLDETGEQVTDRIHRHCRHDDAVDMCKLLGSEKGVDHAVQDYFLHLDMGYEKFVTPPFASPFTGEQCHLLSRPFYNKEGLRFVLCMEMQAVEK